ncbi:MAG: hypothetical protein ABIG28_02775 [archaeon]
MVRKDWGKRLTKLEYRMLEAAGVDEFGQVGHIDEEKMIMGAYRAMCLIRDGGYSDIEKIRLRQEGLVIIYDVCEELGERGLYEFDTGGGNFLFRN